MLKTKKDIKDFFRILAEESVREAKSKIYDDGAIALMNQAKLDNTAFSKITEEELLSRIQSEITEALGYSDTISEQRTKAMDYYYGLPL